MPIPESIPRALLPLLPKSQPLDTISSHGLERTLRAVTDGATGIVGFIVTQETFLADEGSGMRLAAGSSEHFFLESLSDAYAYFKDEATAPEAPPAT